MVAGHGTERLKDERLVYELIDRIYSAAAAPEEWSGFLEQLAELLELRAVNFALAHAQADGSFAMMPQAWGFDDRTIASYDEYYAEIDPRRVPALQVPAGTVETSDILMEDEAFRRSEFYNDYFAPAGLRHSFAAVLDNDGQTVSVLVCHRGRGHAQAGGVELDFLRRLLPHLQRARALSIRLETLESRERILYDVLDRLPVGIVFVDETGAFLRANTMGERILVQGDGLGSNRGRVVAERSHDTQVLHAAIASAARPDRLAANRVPLGLRLPRPSGRRDLDVMVSPISAVSKAWADGRAAAFLVVSDGSSDLEAVSRRMQELYGLSATEAALSAAISSGTTVKEWAQERGVSVETVRWQLKQVFQKTATSRQTELVRLVLLGPALLG